MELVPVLMTLGSFASAVGSGLLYWNSPPDIAEATFDHVKDKQALALRKSRSRCGFGLLLIGSLIQLGAGLIWYGQPAKFG